MSPLQYLGLCLFVTAAATAFYCVTGVRRRAGLMALARQSEMHFSAKDRFGFAAEVARRFPVIGAANPEVADLLYCRRGDSYCYVFRFDYTLGAMGPKVRRRAITGFIESRQRGEMSPLTLAPPAASLAEQYQFVIGQLGAAVTKPGGNSTVAT